MYNFLSKSGFLSIVLSNVIDDTIYQKILAFIIHAYNAEVVSDNAVLFDRYTVLKIEEHIINLQLDDIMGIILSATDKQGNNLVERITSLLLEKNILAKAVN